MIQNRSLRHTAYLKDVADCKIFYMVTKASLDNLMGKGHERAIEYKDTAFGLQKDINWGLIAHWSKLLFVLHLRNNTEIWIKDWLHVLIKSKATLFKEVCIHRRGTISSQCCSQQDSVFPGGLHVQCSFWPFENPAQNVHVFIFSVTSNKPGMITTPHFRTECFTSSLYNTHALCLQSALQIMTFKGCTVLKCLARHKNSYF